MSASTARRYRARCSASDCDWAFEGDLATAEAKATQHKADHRDARRTWRSRCTWGCDWSTTGSEKWVRAAWERHKTEHRAASDAREERRVARYRWRGKPNPTQRRLLERVRVGSLGAHGTLTYIVATGTSGLQWYPSDLSRRDQLWWPALVEAGLVVVRPTWSRHGMPRGLWLLTAAGRRFLAEHVTA